MDTEKQKTVLLGITGGIAAYKVCDLARQLVRANYRVKTIMTQAATEFVGPATFRSLTGSPVATQLFDDPSAPINHISLAEDADIMLIAPATANAIAKLVHGIADDLLTTTALAFQGQLIVAPAMNTQMYLDSVTQENLMILQEQGIILVGPASGQLACGDSGPGRMVEPAQIFAAVEEHVHTSTSLAGKTVLISAGPTREYLDPVRYLSNRSSGKMGIALARAALRAGARVKMVLGPVNVATPVDEMFVRTDVVSAADMYEAMMKDAPDADIIICAAAVSDYRPAQMVEEKIKKGAEATALNLVQNSDILADMGQMKMDGRLKEGALLVGFAAETSNIESNAVDKLQRKGADFIVANDVSRADIGFESDNNEISIFQRTQTGVELLRHIDKASKIGVARQIIDCLGDTF